MNATCPGCAARIPHPRPERCDYCGAPLPAPLLAFPSTPSLEPLPTAPARSWRAEFFERLRTHPSLPELLSRAPARDPAIHTYLGARVLVGIVFIALFVVYAANRSAWRDNGPLLLVGLAVLGFAALGWSKRRIRDYTRAPLLRRLAVVVGHRIDSRDRRRLGRHETAYVTLEFEDGKRREYEILEEEIQQLAAGDAGVAYTVLDTLISFARVPI